MSNQNNQSLQQINTAAPSAAPRARPRPDAVEAKAIALFGAH